MRRADSQTKFKIAKGQLVHIVSMEDIPVVLKEDQCITRDQFEVLFAGKVLVKQAGFLFEAHVDQMKPQRDPVEQEEVPQVSTWQLYDNEEISYCSLSDERDACGEVSYAHHRRPSGSGRVIRSLKI